MVINQLSIDIPVSPMKFSEMFILSAASATAATSAGVWAM